MPSMLPSRHMVVSYAPSLTGGHCSCVSSKPGVRHPHTTLKRRMLLQRVRVRCVMPLLSGVLTLQQRRQLHLRVRLLCRICSSGHGGLLGHHRSHPALTATTIPYDPQAVGLGTAWGRVREKMRGAAGTAVRRVLMQRGARWA